MLILIADDDPLTRRLLQALLTKLGHEVQMANDGETAWKILEGTDAPAMAILDWMMPGLTGPEVCKRLRANPGRSRPYVILLSAKSEKQDVIAGLDAGADDYLPKPFNPMELLARLRVAQRIISYHQDLQKHIGDMEMLLQRHNLLGEMFGRQGRGGMSTQGGTDAGSRVVEHPSASRPATSPWLTHERVNEMLARSLNEVGLTGGQAFTVADANDAPEAAFTAWAPLLLVSEGLWVDLLLEADDGSAVAMFESLLGRIPVSERELLDVFAETFNLICTAIKVSLSEHGCLVLAPVISRSIRSSALNFSPPARAEMTRHRVRLPSILLDVSVIRQFAPVVRKSLGQLNEMDVVAENLPSPSSPEVFLLNQGVVLNQRYIEKLSSLARAEQKQVRVAIITPSRLTQFFCLGRVGG